MFLLTESRHGARSESSDTTEQRPRQCAHSGTLMSVHTDMAKAVLAIFKLQLCDKSCCSHTQEIPVSLQGDNTQPVQITAIPKCLTDHFL